MRVPTADRPTPAPRVRQRGLTLVEMMVTILIALFLLAGVGYMLQHTRDTYTSESQLAALQDSQRLAMTLITDVVQSAGYFPNPTQNTIDTALPVAAPFAQDQSISGVQGASAPGDTLTVRYVTTGSDGILNCLGTSNTLAAGPGTNITYTNQFSLTAADASGSSTLQCALTDSSTGKTSPPQALVSGLTNMQIWFGVKRNPAGAGNNVDTYLRPGEMLAADWTSITSVRIRLTFLNPLAAKTAAKTIDLERVIAVMNRAGVSS